MGNPPSFGAPRPLHEWGVGWAPFLLGPLLGPAEATVSWEILIRVSFRQASSCTETRELQSPWGSHVHGEELQGRRRSPVLVRTPLPPEGCLCARFQAKFQARGQRLPFLASWSLPRTKCEV